MAVVILQLVGQFAAAAEPLASVKALAEIRAAAGQPVEHRE